MPTSSSLSSFRGPPPEGLEEAAGGGGVNHSSGAGASKHSSCDTTGNRPRDNVASEPRHRRSDDGCPRADAVSTRLFLPDAGGDANESGGPRGGGRFFNLGRDAHGRACSQDGTRGHSGKYSDDGDDYDYDFDYDDDNDGGHNHAENNHNNGVGAKKQGPRAVRPFRGGGGGGAASSCSSDGSGVGGSASVAMRAPRYTFRYRAPESLRAASRKALLASHFILPCALCQLWTPLWLPGFVTTLCVWLLGAISSRNLRALGVAVFLAASVCLLAGHCYLAAYFADPCEFSPDLSAAHGECDDGYWASRLLSTANFVAIWCCLLACVIYAQFLVMIVRTRAGDKVYHEVNSLNDSASSSLLSPRHPSSSAGRAATHDESLAKRSSSFLPRSLLASPSRRPSSHAHRTSSSSLSSASASSASSAASAAASRSRSGSTASAHDPQHQQERRFASPRARAMERKGRSGQRGSADSHTAGGPRASRAESTGSAHSLSSPRIRPIPLARQERITVLTDL